MKLPEYASPLERVWHYTYLFICGCIFLFLIAPILIILPLSEVVRRFVVAANIPPPRNVINSRRRTLECLMAGDAQGAIEAVNTHLEIVHQSIRKRFPESELPAVEDPQASEK